MGGVNILRSTANEKVSDTSTLIVPIKQHEYTQFIMSNED